ncbi:MAG: HAD family hydrolase [Candidatus Methanofastidiosia archaeon]
MVVAVVFDMDGTLVDVSASYKEAIIETVEFFIDGIDREKVRKEVALLKDVPNFNNDWDASYYIIKKLRGETPDTNRGREWKSIRDVFQEIFLGEELYKEAYGKKCSFCHTPGFIKNERIAIKKSSLEKLSHHKLGIVTSRPWFETQYTISTTCLKDFFSRDNVITLDDVEKEKPDPESLLLMKQKLGADKHYYIGDTIDDATAARKAGYISIVIGSDNGDIRIDDVNEVSAII